MLEQCVHCVLMLDNYCFQFLTTKHQYFPKAVHLQGERSTWNSCNNSAAESNRLSPVSATEIPDSPTQCAPLADSTRLSEREFDSTGENEVRDEVSISKEVLLEAPKSNMMQSSNGENSSTSKNVRNIKGMGSINLCIYGLFALLMLLLCNI